MKPRKNRKRHAITTIMILCGSFIHSNEKVKQSHKAKSIFDGSGQAWINENTSNQRVRELLQVLTPYLIEAEFEYRIEHAMMEISSHENPIDRPSLRSHFKAEQFEITVHGQAPAEKAGFHQRRRTTAYHSEIGLDDFWIRGNPYQIIACLRAPSFFGLLRLPKALTQEPQDQALLSFHEISDQAEIQLTEDQNNQLVCENVLNPVKHFRTMTTNAPLNTKLAVAFSPQEGEAGSKKKVFRFDVPESLKDPDIKRGIHKELNLKAWLAYRGVANRLEFIKPEQ